MMRPPRLYFSLRSPYSWLAVHNLRTKVPNLFQEMQVIPFWQPDELSAEALRQRGGDTLYQQMSRAKHLYLLMDVKRLADRAGLSIRWPVDVDPWWELPHLAWLLAQRKGRAVEFYDGLMEARWGQGQNICDPEVVRAVARRAEIDPELAVSAPHDLSLREEAVSCLYSAYLDDVFGVPYLKWGMHRFWGVDRVEAFLQIWQPTGLPAELLDARYAYDADTVGGCG
jgi:2-hydroxychromene-2-carboxylate isomerase